MSMWRGVIAMTLEAMPRIPVPTVLATFTLITAYPTSYDETFYLDPGSRRFLMQTDLELANITVRRGELSYLYSGLHYCPYNQHSSPRKGSASDALQRTSSCPWYWTLNFDSQRDPTMILTAACACHDCQDSTALLGNVCQPVHYFRKIKYVHEKKSYGHRLFPVVVGCTCNRYSSYDARA
ncbi:uncharacterized protein LOC112563318 [Pomacea canaliculata]|uniref:uncharacterized protein LOC112563318 n=1 Tax=Pomacea canaliculata TaxID=400727 RepID=UPI000D73764E|nr:uncharacterized protein LOC112563318 [Pomacea canaliculata]